MDIRKKHLNNKKASRGALAQLKERDDQKIARHLLREAYEDSLFASELGDEMENEMLLTEAGPWIQRT